MIFCFARYVLFFQNIPSSAILKICWGRQSPPSRSLRGKSLAAIISTSFWPWGDIRGPEPTESLLDHNNAWIFTVVKFSDRLLGISWAHIRLMSLYWCCSSLARYSKVFLLFWCLSIASYHILLIIVNGTGKAIFFLHVSWFTFVPLQSCHCQKMYPIFICNIHFLTTFNFWNYYSTLVSIVTICLF